MVHALCAFFNRYGLQVDGYAASRQVWHELERTPWGGLVRRENQLPAEVVICRPHERLRREEVPEEEWGVDAFDEEEEDIPLPRRGE